MQATIFNHKHMISHKLSYQATWYGNGDSSRPGHMIDFVLVNNRFHSSVLNTRVYCSVCHEFDHEFMVSSLCLKIKAKRHQPRAPFWQTTDLPAIYKSVFKMTLSSTFDSVKEHSRVEPVWLAFKAAINEAHESLPDFPRKK